MKYSAIALALAAALAATPAAAQGGDAKAELAKVKPKDFPTDPIEFTVVYPAGGGMDVTGAPARQDRRESQRRPDHREQPHRRRRHGRATHISPRRPSPTATRSA